MTDHTHSLPKGWILCPDERLCRLLEAELAFLGVAAVSYPDPPPPADDVAVILLDRDALSPSDGQALAAACGCPLLSFGRAPYDGPADPKVTDLHRPFGLDELERALRSLLTPPPPVGRPVPSSLQPLSPTPPSRTVSTEQPTLTAADGTVTVGDHTVALTPVEWAILQRLLARRGETVSRAELSLLLNGGGNSVDVYVCRLRSKIEKPLGRRIIWTVRGAGYRME